MTNRSRFRRRVAGATGCLVVGTGLLWILAILLLSLFGVLVDREDWSDVRFNGLLYVGRTCRGLKIQGEPHDDAVVSITKTRGDTVRDLGITVKYFIGNGPQNRPVVKHSHPALASGQAISFDPPERDDIRYLGMIYVLVKCDKGYAVHRAWYSFWS